ncbi:J domain-containing protein [Niabella insulamsoli]|uniref:J domain-containing protein n=1 Tax=Niabella insulamsoli TaxID=3144874 RepID=UPI0031FDFBF9
MAVDYYQILQIAPSADLSEIKAAYRKLAHRFHPDKNPHSKESDAHFELIKEAYETLSNPIKKEKYLQERWLYKANHQQFEQPVHTPQYLLKEVLQASENISRLDVYRMNKEGVRDELLLLLAEERVSLLNNFGEISVNDAIVLEFIQLISVLPVNDRLRIYDKLLQINTNHKAYIIQKKEDLSSHLFWDNWKPAFIILIVVLLCILIWGTSLKY